MLPTILRSSFATQLPEPSLLAAMGVLSSQISKRSGIDESPTDRLLESLEQHAESEAESVRHYRELAQASPDPVVALLMKLVVADEERHHRLLNGLAVRLRDSLHWTHSADAVPTEAAHPETSREIVEATCQRLLEEREGTEYLRRMARENRDLYDGLFELLLEVMALDSQRHERILEYLQKRLAASNN